MISWGGFLRLGAAVAAAALLPVMVLPAAAQELRLALEDGQVLNLYSSRHYATDEALYENFTAETGIAINRLEAGGDALTERLKTEGRDSPADVFITDDAGRLWRAEEAELFTETHSAVLDAAIPAHLRHPDGLWFGYSSRARVIVYNKALIDPADLLSYEDLADPRWRGQVCIRSSSSVFNLSLLASLIARLGVEAAGDWARGVVANFARNPAGGDTDQIRAVASGECGIGVANTYHYARLMRSEKDADKAVVEVLGVIFPNQSSDEQRGRGAHVNISGAGVLANAPHPENAVRFLEYLASPSAQRTLANGNNEYPVVAGVLDNPALIALGPFAMDGVNVSVFGINQAEARLVFDRAGWQ